MPHDYLDPPRSKIDGLAFLGLSLSRKSEQGHPDSVTHQTSFDLNDILDRDYEFLLSSNDDGWLVGGGEPGPPVSYKLTAKDSAHVEILRIGTYQKDWGGVPLEEILDVMKSGEILIPQIEVLPTAVVENPDLPPELEIRFDMEPAKPNFKNLDAPLPVNWQLRFLHNQLFKRFEYPSRFCPGAFHSTIMRKAEFRSKKHRKKYLAKCAAAVEVWKEKGVQPLNTVPRGPEGQEAEGDNREDECHSGIWLFTDRENITHFFQPNFLPPYVGEKRKQILEVLKEEWDTKTLSWKKIDAGALNGKRRHWRNRRSSGRGRGRGGGRGRDDGRGRGGDGVRSGDQGDGDNTNSQPRSKKNAARKKDKNIKKGS